MCHVETGGNCFESRVSSTDYSLCAAFLLLLEDPGNTRDFYGVDAFVDLAAPIWRGWAEGHVWKPHWPASTLQEPEANAPFS